MIDDTFGDDILSGAPGDDVNSGGAGNDLIDSGDRDTVDSGAGTNRSLACP